MSVTIDKVTYDTMKEACERLSIHRNTMLAYLKDGFFEQPPTHPQGRSRKPVRYFTEDWYAENEPKMQNPDDNKSLTKKSNDKSKE